MVFAAVKAEIIISGDLLQGLFLFQCNIRRLHNTFLGSTTDIQAIHGVRKRADLCHCVSGTSQYYHMTLATSLSIIQGLLQAQLQLQDTHCKRSAWLSKQCALNTYLFVTMLQSAGEIKISKE